MRIWSRWFAPASRPMVYDLPPELLGKVWKGEYRGQEQHWFLERFLGGSDADIDLVAHDPPEFAAYKWVPLRKRCPPI